MKEVKAECGACGGKGLYSGMCEAEGEAVVCLRCKGSGCEIIKYKEFTGRKGSRGIHTIRRSRGSFIGTGVGPVGDSISYHEFVDGNLP